VTGLEWRKDGLWNVKEKGGESLGVFDAVIIADKGLASTRFLAQTGLPPPLGIFLTFVHFHEICTFEGNGYCLWSWWMYLHFFIFEVGREAISITLCLKLGERNLAMLALQKELEYQS
jgi:hypothetical protein